MIQAVLGNHLRCGRLTDDDRIMPCESQRIGDAVGEHVAEEHGRGNGGGKGEERN